VERKRATDQQVAPTQTALVGVKFCRRLSDKPSLTIQHTDGICFVLESRAESNTRWYEATPLPDRAMLSPVAAASSQYPVHNGFLAGPKSSHGFFSRKLEKGESCGLWVLEKKIYPNLACPSTRLLRCSER